MSQFINVLLAYSQLKQFVSIYKFPIVFLICCYNSNYQSISNYINICKLAALVFV